MAKLYPSFSLEPCPSSEEKVKSALADVDDITVLHSVVWQSHRNNRQGDGEADFVILWPGRGILILEVKGGGVFLEDGTWYSTDRHGKTHKIKDPFKQAQDSKFALLKFFKRSRKSLKKIPIMHGVVFPDINVEGSISINAPRELIVDKNDLKNPSVSFLRIVEYWNLKYQFPSGYLDIAQKLLAPTIQITRHLSDQIEESERSIIQLTEEQSKVLYSLRRASKAIVYGGAGTGKTILAIEKAKQLEKTGMKVLLLCYNQLLKQKIKKDLAPSDIVIETFHSFVVSVAGKSEATSLNIIGENWYENEAASILDSERIKRVANFDAIIIDEAQDFSPVWLEKLTELVAQNGVLYLFADSHQDLYLRGWEEPPGLSPYDLTVNCRNTSPIAKRVAAIFNDEVSPNLPNGPEPKLIEVDNTDEFFETTLDIVESLLSDGVTIENISVISNSNPFIRELRQQCVGEYVFTDYLNYGITVESIARFKGLESQVVIALVDEDTQRPITAESYVALSRARSVLYLVSTKSVIEQLAWPASSA
ncbi:NERD domain-containing protein [Idiomarina abyssalis]|uniref:nuclease-related domain-containing DEAD/DEAH box helicase n=1 Tax=Idiomarina abyssalis TaxID=86102 RepID=UPI003A8DE625